MAFCRLCRKSRKLINAHIIPRSFYVALDNSEGPMKIVASQPGAYARRSPNGIYDPNILCAECDNAIGGQLETHAVEQLLRPRERLAVSDSGTHLAHIYAGADPNRIFRFIASIAWRASVSTQAFFRSFDIGLWEEQLRPILLDREFSLSAHQPDFDANIVEFDQWSVPFLLPFRTRIEGLSYLCIFAARFCFYLKLDRRPTSDPLDETALSARTARGDTVTLLQCWKTSKERQAMREILLRRRDTG